MKYLITGGAGFIGSNYANRLIQRGDEVTIFDNLSRGGAQKNLDWLMETYGKNKFTFIRGEVRDFDAIKDAVQDQQVIMHLAAQVAVTTSVEDPQTDFEINARGTFNVLEAARTLDVKPIVVYASTNKVYGELEDLHVVEEDTRYMLENFPEGIDETRGLDFHSPYGCSKGAGDQYVRDYFRIYGIPTVVFRQSCIYGMRQFGIEDQGWVAWFIIALLKNHPITIYGDGKQIRDLLFIDDLLDAYDLAIANISQCRGEVFNVGGGIDNSISIWKEFSKILERISGKQIHVDRKDWRPGDQKVYISDISKIRKVLAWNPKINVEDGITRLYNWAEEKKGLFA
ncbi:MAG: NAD-dependent epimerase/dehydratase family protein [Chloroflexi bacterium]|nr:NAD-dependent epimerase/dehydratase family protein [Chloroflexota bacterium]